MGYSFIAEPIRKQLLAVRHAELIKELFEYMPAFPLSHACIVMDLTPIVTINRCVGWTSPLTPLLNGEGNVP